MKVNITVYFHCIENKEEWKQTAIDAVKIYMPKLKYIIEDLPYNTLGARIIYLPDKRIKTVVTSGTYITHVSFTDLDTEDNFVADYCADHCNDFEFSNYTISVYE